jgi:pyruvate carboxylase
MYSRVNHLFGDIVKVTPSSKVVGDMALYMVQNNLTEDDIYERGESLDFPDSVVELFKGYIGQPHGGFPEKLQKLILKGQEPITVRPGELLEPVSFDDIKAEFKETHDLELSDQDAVCILRFIRKCLPSMLRQRNCTGTSQCLIHRPSSTA